MRLRDLEGLLQSVPAFDAPKAKLEQYPTGAHLASRMLFTIHSTYDDLQDALVADLGVGCGVLSIGCVAMGAGACVGFDIDPDALQAAQQNAAEFELDPSLELVQCNVAAENDSDEGDAGDEGEDEGERSVFPWRGAVDTVVMNPPFGTKNNAGIDMAFLRRAISMCEGAVYSLHKTSTRKFIEKQARQMGVKSEVVAEMRYDLPQTYKFHKKKSVDIEVDFWRFDCSSKEA